MLANWQNKNLQLRGTQTDQRSRPHKSSEKAADMASPQPDVERYSHEVVGMTTAMDATRQEG